MKVSLIKSVLILVLCMFTFQGIFSKSIRHLNPQLSETLVFGNDEEEGEFVQLPGKILTVNDVIYVLDISSASIKKYDGKGHLLTAFGRKGSGPRELVNPTDFTIHGEKIYVSNSGNARIEVFDLSGNYISSFKLMQEPLEICTDSAGNLLINFTWKNNLVHRYTGDGKYLDSLVPVSKEKDMMRAMFYNMITMAIDPSDQLFVLYRFRNKIEKYGADGKCILAFERPLDIEYQALRPVKSDDGMVRLKAFTLNGSIALGDQMLFVTHSSRPKNGKKDLCDIIHTNGVYVGTFKLPVEAACIHVSCDGELYLGNGYESTVHKYVVTGLPGNEEQRKLIKKNKE